MMVQASVTSTPAAIIDSEQLTEPPAIVAVESATSTQAIKELIVNESLRAEINPKLALKIARCESQFRQFDVKTGKVLRGLHNPKDIGVFQINEKFHLNEAKKLGLDIYTLEGNVAYAVWEIKQNGPKAWHWSQKCWSELDSVKLAQN